MATRTPCPGVTWLSLRADSLSQSWGPPQPLLSMPTTARSPRWSFGRWPVARELSTETGREAPPTPLCSAQGQALHLQRLQVTAGPSVGCGLRAPCPELGERKGELVRW